MSVSPSPGVFVSNCERTPVRKFARFPAFLLTLASVGAAGALCVCRGDDIASDSGIPLGQNLSGEPISVNSSDSKKAEAMTIFSDAYLQAFGRGALGPQGIELLFKALDLDPNSQELIRDIISELAKSGALSKNLDRLNEIALKHKESTNLANGVSEVLENEGRRTEAIKVLDSAFESVKTRELSPDDLQALPSLVSKLALLKAISGDIEGADSTIIWAFQQQSLSKSLQTLQAAMAVYSSAKAKADKSSPWWSLWLLDSEEKTYSDKLKECSDNFVKEAISSNEHLNTSLFHTAIGLLKEQGRLEDGRKVLLNWLATNPDNIETLTTLAKVCFDMGDFSNSCRYWRLAIRNGLKPSAIVYSSYALALREAGNLNEAANIYEWQLILDPENKVATLQLALNYMEMGRLEKCLSRLASISSTYNGMYLKALCLSRLKLHSEALEALLKSETLAGETEKNILAERSYRLLRASFAEKARKPDLVKDSVQPLIDKDGKDYEALNFLGYTLADMNKDLDFSEKCIRKALEGEPDNAAFLDSMAWVLYRKGKASEAKHWIEKAIAVSGEKAVGVLYDHAGDIYAALGDGETALKNWSLAIEAPSEELDVSRVKAKIKAAERSSNDGGASGK